MEPILTPELLFERAGIPADIDAVGMQEALARRGWQTRVEGPVPDDRSPGPDAVRHRVVAVHAGGTLGPNDPAAHPTHLERTAASVDIALRGVLATVLALELGAAANASDANAASAQPHARSPRSPRAMRHDPGSKPPCYLIGFELHTGRLLAVGQAATLCWAQCVAIQVAAAVRAVGGTVVVVIDATTEQTRERVAIGPCGPPFA